MTALLRGLVNQSMTRDMEGHRTYELRWHFRTDNSFDGPETVLQAASVLLLPVGSAYVEGTDYDPWAFATPELSIAPHRDVKEGDPVQDWEVSQLFTTKPMFRCSTAEIENPLLEPYQITGEFTHVSREVKVDRKGKPLTHSNTEPIKGPQVEAKISYPAITLTFNSAVLPLSTINNLINKVNDRPLWGHPKRCVKFVDARWERLLYGICFYYYKISFRFEFNLETFDRQVPSMGRKVAKKNAILEDHSDPLRRIFKDPEDYGTTEEVYGEDLGEVMLDKYGQLAKSESDVYIQTVELDKEGNLLLLGVPSTLP